MYITLPRSTGVTLVGWQPDTSAAQIASEVAIKIGFSFSTLGSISRTHATRAIRRAKPIREVHGGGDQIPKPRAGFGLPGAKKLERCALRAVSKGCQERRSGSRETRSGRSRRAAAPRRSEAEPRDLLK